MFMTKNKPLLSGNHQIVGPHMNQNRHKTMPLPRKCLHLEHQESGSIMVNQTFDKAFPLSEEKSPVQCSSDYLQAFLNFAWFFFFFDSGFCSNIFCTLDLLPCSALTWQILVLLPSLQSRAFHLKKPFSCIHTY